MFAELPFHPKFVHLPIALAVLLPLVSAVVLAAWWRGWFRPRTWSLIAGLQLLLVASALIAMRTGEDDEERVEPIVGEPAIEAHEEAALAFTWGSAFVFVLSVLPLLASRSRIALPLGAAAVLGTGGVLVLGIQVGTAGGDLVYSRGAAQAYVQQGGLAVPVPAAHSEREDR